MIRKSKWLARILKVGVSIFSFYLIVFFVQKAQPEELSFSELLRLLVLIPSGQAFFLLLAFILLPVNFFFSFVKWRILIRKLESNLSDFRIVKSLLVGSFLSLLSPNKIGDYAGRALFLEPGIKAKGFILGFLDSFCQMLATVLFGAFGMFMLFSYPFDFVNSGYFGILISICILYFCFGIILLLFPVKLVFVLNNIFPQSTWMETLRQSLTVFNERKLRSKVFGFSCFRYLVFSIQYYFCLRFFGFEGNGMVIFAGIFLVYLLKSVVPFSGFAELGIREVAAVSVLGVLSVSPGIAFSATFCLYLINIIFPAIFGVVFLGDVKHSFKW